LLEKTIDYRLPKEYKNFLQFTNDLEFQHHVAEILLILINEILSYYDIFDYPDNMLVIATCMSAQLHIAINLHLNDNYPIYVIYPISDNFFMDIGCNFTEFLINFLPVTDLIFGIGE